MTPRAIVAVAVGAALWVGLVVPSVVLGGSSGVAAGGAPAGYVAGCVLSFSGDAGPITSTAGTYRNRADSATVTAAAVSLASAFQAFDWATGGGLDTGAEASSTWYATHLVEHTDGTDAILLSTSASAPSEPSGMSSRRLLGWVRNDGSSDLLQCIQAGDGTTRTMLYRGETLALTAPFNVLSNGGGTVATAVDCAGVVPPTQADVVLVGVLYTPSTGGLRIMHGDDTFAQAYSGFVGGYSTENGARGNVQALRLDGDEDVQYFVASGAGAYIDVIGWVGVFDGSE